MSEYIPSIDTGGTYTDRVLLEQNTRDVIKTAKTLTTKQNLNEGILTALQDRLPEDPSQNKLVVISTTMATNAIAENKDHLETERPGGYICNFRLPQPF